MICYVAGFTVGMVLVCFCYGLVYFVMFWYGVGMFFGMFWYDFWYCFTMLLASLLVRFWYVFAMVLV
jgi:hypothetical protein